MKYILNIYKKDTRTKSGKRLVGSYEYDRKDKESMAHEIKTLYSSYKESDGFIFKVIEPQ